MDFDKEYPRLRNKAYLAARRKNLPHFYSEEVADDACVRLYQEINKGRDIRNPESFVATTAANLAINKIKELERHNKVQEKAFTNESDEERAKTISYYEELRDYLEEIDKSPLNNDIKNRLGLNSAGRQDEACELFYKNILEGGKPDYRDIGKKMNISYSRVGKLLNLALTDRLLSNFIKEIMNGNIDERAAAKLTAKEWRNNPLRNIMKKIAMFGQDDQLYKVIQRRNLDFYNLGMDAFEKMVGKGNTIKQEYFYRACTYLYIAASFQNNDNQKIMGNIGEQFIIKDHCCPVNDFGIAHKS